MAIYVLRNARLPGVLDKVFSELDDALSPLGETTCFFPSKGEEGKESRYGSNGHSRLNVSKFGPDELKVNIDGRTLTVEGKQEVKEDSHYTKSFLRQWTLPEGVDVEQIRSSLTDEGQLAIELPKPKPAINSRSIPMPKGTAQS
ncbi:Hsp20/alpha crystallin family protein [Cooperia oncophora]